jgi:PAS domain S-box-containing protein
MTLFKSLQATLIWSLLIVAVFSVSLVGSMWIYQEYRKFNNEIVLLKSEYIDTQKSFIKDQVNSVLSYIEFNKANYEQDLKASIKSRVYEASAIANNIYYSNAGQKSDKEIIKMIKDAIRPLTFNQGRGYFFIYTMEGGNVLLPFSPQLEGKNLWDLQDSTGAYSIRETARMVRENREGFQRWFWYKPGDQKIMYEKIGFHKYFEPYDWWIGTGEYLVDFQQDIKQNVLNWLNEIRYNEDGYIFVYDFDGNILAHFLRETVNTNIKDANDDYGVYVVNELIKTSRQPGGGFFNYEGKIKPSTGLRANKIAYAVAEDDWEWTVGTGVYIDGIDEVIEDRRNNLIVKTLKDLISIFIILACSLLVVGLILRLISQKTTDNFLIFTDFFDQTLTKSLKIDEKKVNFYEFKVLAGSANKMLDERNKAEEELRQLRNYLSNIINSMPSVIVGVNNEWEITQWNKNAEQSLGFSAEEVHGKDLAEIMSWIASDIPDIFKSISSGQIWHVQKKHRPNTEGFRYEDYTIYPLMDNGLTGAVIRIDDVTEYVRMEEMVVQNEKMLSIGGLAAGMAHEINNPLAGIMQTCEVMSNRLGKNLNFTANIKAAEDAGTNIESIRNFMFSREIPLMLEIMRTSGKRIAEIIDNMLSFSRKSENRKSSHQINRLLDNILDLAATDYDLKKDYDFKSIRVMKNYDPELPPVVCEATKIQQVLLNIIKNGAQAMHSAKSEHPTFHINSYYDENREMVCIEIKDNGPGMDEKTKKKVFDPFFTTKAVGTGTGLGLSVSYFIITEDHNGEMVVESRLGEGASFILRLPKDGGER